MIREGLVIGFGELLLPALFHALYYPKIGMESQEKIFHIWDGYATFPLGGTTMNLGTKIRQRREQLGLSQQELAQRLGMTQARISEIESGARPHVNLNNLRNLARTLGVSADYLIGTWEDGEAPLSPTAAPSAAEVPAAARRRGRPRGHPRQAAPASVRG